MGSSGFLLSSISFSLFQKFRGVISKSQHLTVVKGLLAPKPSYWICVLLEAPGLWRQQCSGAALKVNLCSWYPSFSPHGRGLCLVGAESTLESAVPRS